MPLREFRVAGYRAWNDSGLLTVPGRLAIIGPNDAGKSGLLQALQMVFEAPKRGAISPYDVHGMSEGTEIVVEAAFDPRFLQQSTLAIDAKNSVDIRSGGLLDSKGLFRVRVRLSGGTERFELCVHDIDDALVMPLALSSHDRLMSLLQVFELEAVPAGRETNQDKRDRIRAAALAQGRTLRDQWIYANDHAKEIRRILPPYLYFPDSARFGASETGVQNQLRSVVDKAVDGTSGAQQVADHIATSIQAEVATLFTHFARWTGAITHMTAEPDINWRKAVDDIALSWTDAYGVNLPYERRGAGMRRLFQVAYFQYEAMEWPNDENAPRYVFAIEEPEVHLHPGAQRELSETFAELAAQGHTVLFTSHSPVFVGTSDSRGTVLVTRNAVASEALQHPHFDATRIARELGVVASDRLLGKHHVILVEGKHDVGFYEHTLKALHANGATRLNPADVTFLHSGGLDSLGFAVTQRKMDEVGLKWAIVADSDRTGQGADPSQDVQALLSAIPASCATAIILERTSIENYLDPAAVSAELGFACTVPKYGPITRSSGLELTRNERKSLKASVTRIAERMDAQSIISHSSDGTGLTSELAVHFETIRRAFAL